MTAVTSAISSGLREEKKDGIQDGDQMKAEELKQLIREVLAEQDEKMNLKTGTKTPQALKAEILETIKNIDVEKIKSQELMFLNQMLQWLLKKKLSNRLLKKQFKTTQRLI